MVRAWETGTTCTIAMRFVDTNILIYAHDRDAGEKRRLAVGLLTELWASGEGCLSTQVLQEFLVNVTRKIPTPLAMSDARELIRTYSPWVRVATEPAMVLRATEIAEVWRLSFWDSMIVAGAEASGASLVYSEDLAHGQIISGIRIENPFSPTR